MNSALDACAGQVVLMVLPKVRRMLKTGPRRAAGHRCCPAAVAFTFLRDSRIISILLYLYYYYYCEEQRIPSQSILEPHGRYL